MVSCAAKTMKVDAGRHARIMSSNWSVKSNARQSGLIRGPKPRSAPGGQDMIAATSAAKVGSRGHTWKKDIHTTPRYKGAHRNLAAKGRLDVVSGPHRDGGVGIDTACVNS
jgi:hypothetical protein